jgi:FSR family fosmidomycin resistance protein-like MFS transporter
MEKISTLPKKTGIAMTQTLLDAPSLPLDGKPSDLPTLKRILLARLSTGHFLADIFAGFMLPLLPMLAHKLGLGLGVTGLILTVSSFSSSVLQPGFGWLSDKFKGFNYVLVGVCIAALFISQIGTATSLPHLLALVALGYVGVGLFHPQGTTLADNLSQGDRNAVMGMFISIGTLGFASGPILSSTLVSNFGLEGTLYAGAAIFLALPLLWKVPAQVSGYQDQRKQLDNLTHEDILVNEDILTIEKSNPLQKPTPVSNNLTQNLKNLSRAEQKLLGQLSLIGICRAVLLVGLPTYLPFFWTEKGYSVQAIGWVIGISSLVGVPFGIWAGKLGDRLGEKILMVLSFVPTLILLPIMFWVEDWLGFTAFILLTGFLEATLATSLVIGLKGIQAFPNTISAIVGGFSWGIAGLFMPLIGWGSEIFGIAPVLMLLTSLAAVALILSLLLPDAFHKPVQLLKSRS